MTKLKRRKKKIEVDLNFESLIPMVSEILRPDGSWVISKVLVEMFQDIRKAAFFTELLYCYDKSRKEKTLLNDQWFTITYDEIKDKLFLSVKRQRLYVKELVDIKLIEVKMTGMPAKQYYKITENLTKLLFIKQVLPDLPKPIGLALPKREGLAYYNNILYITSPNRSSKNIINNILPISLSRSNEKPGGFSQHQKTSSFSDKEKLLENRKTKSSYSRETESIFDYWNNLGSPLTRHRRETKGYHQTCKVIDQTLIEFSEKEIKQAIKNYFDLIIDPSNSISNKVNSNVPGCKVSLLEFFGFTKETRQRMRLNKVSLPIRSWFDECVTYSNAELDKKYGMFIEDHHEKLTKEFRTQWLTITKQEKVSPKEENDLRRASVRFKQFISDYESKMILSITEKRNLQELIHYVFEAIGSDVKGDWSIVSSGWMASDRTYQKRLPGHLINVGVMRKEEEDDMPKKSFSIYD